VGPYGVDQYPKRLGPSDEFEKAAYIFVYQDVRGRYMSEGTFVEMRPHIDEKKSSKDVDDSSDTYDTIEYLLKHVPNNNGRVGIWGISYPGFYTSASIIDSHPALKAASPQAPMTNLFMGDDAYHGGAFMLDANFGFYVYFKPQENPTLPVRSVPFDFGTPNGYEFYLKASPTSNLDKNYLKGTNPLFNDQMYHTTYDDYWKARDLSQHMKNIHCAVLTVGGWFDAEDLSGPMRTYYAIEKNNPGTVNTIVEGPWVHGGWARNDGDHLGDVHFNSKTAEYFRKNIQFPFFEYYLKDKGAQMPEAYVFETGTNVWRKYDSWPPAQAKPRMLYFHSGGKLSLDPPAAGEGSDSYVSDPAHPVPFVGYVTDTVPQRYMVDDQRFAATRTDVLVYQTEPLTEDVTIAGPISPKLKVATAGTDSDFVVKLIDVYPDEVGREPRMGGYELMIAADILRGRYRDSLSEPKAIPPDQKQVYRFALPTTNHVFLPGHRIMVQVQSSWFPVYDRNPQTYVENIFFAKPADYKKATVKIFDGGPSASFVELPVVHQR